MSGQPGSIIRVYRNQQLIFETTNEVMHVRPRLYGLWTFGEHWALEALDSITIDGQVANSRSGYQKSYEFHRLGGKPVFFFEKSSQLGVNIAGQEISLPGNPHSQPTPGTYEGEKPWKISRVKTRDRLQDVLHGLFAQVQVGYIWKVVLALLIGALCAVVLAAVVRRGGNKIKVIRHTFIIH